MPVQMNAMWPARRNLFDEVNEILDVADVWHIPPAIGVGTGKQNKAAACLNIIIYYPFVTGS